MKFNFNLSPSAISIWFNSQLTFFYQYVIKAEIDTITNPVYADGGNAVHHALEEYAISKDKQKATQVFIDYWDAKSLDIKLGFNKKPLPKDKYYTAFLRGCDLLDNKYIVEKSEMAISFPSGRDNCNFKGFIDLVCFEDGVKKIVDWKTSSSKDAKNNSKFRKQVLMYAWLYWKKTGEVILNSKIEYLKIASVSEFKFTEEEVKNFDKNVLYPILDKIEELGLNPRNYEIGDYDTPFSSHKKKCHQEMLVRQNFGAIQVYRKNNRIIFVKGLDKHLKEFINDYFSFDVQGREFSPKFRSKVWDGKKRFFKKDSLPFSFIWKLEELINAYNQKFNTKYWLNLYDKRNLDVVNTKYGTKFKDSDIVLRPYQEEAIKSMLSKKIGIVFGGTGMGKTLLSAEFIKRVDKRTLILVNRIELLRQTADEYENYLGVEVGRMTEGVLDIDKQITIASIQTIASILKRKNSDSKKLKMYLYNVTCCIADESQNIKDAGQYKQIADEMANLDYIIGLSGSPYRNGPDTLEMNSLVGFIIYTKTTKELEDEGYLCPTKTYFLGIEQCEGFETNEYHENYETFIIKHQERNDTIVKIVEKHRSHKKIMILCKSVEHGELLSKLIPNSFFLYGQTKDKLRKEKFEEFKNTKELVLVSMVQIMGTGVNIKDLDIIINASAFGSDISSIQTIGRTKRLSPGKKFGYFIDFNDLGLFQPMARKRIKILEAFDNPVNKKLHYTEWEKMDIEDE